MINYENTVALGTLDNKKVEHIIDIALSKKIRIYGVSTRLESQLIPLFTGQIAHIRSNHPNKSTIIIDGDKGSPLYVDPPYDQGWINTGRAIRVSLNELRITTADLKNLDLLPQKQKTDLAERERATLLKIILGMAIDKYGYRPEEEKNPATGTNRNSIYEGLEKAGLSVNDDTIRKYLNEAKSLYCSIKKSPSLNRTK
jgi:hypothetical protein